MNPDYSWIFYSSYKYCDPGLTTIFIFKFPFLVEHLASGLLLRSGWEHLKLFLMKEQCLAPMSVGRTGSGVPAEVQRRDTGQPHCSGSLLGALTPRQEKAAGAPNWECAGRLSSCPAAGKVDVMKQTALLIRPTGIAIAEWRSAWATKVGHLDVMDLFTSSWEWKIMLKFEVYRSLQTLQFLACDFH